MTKYSKRLRGVRGLIISALERDAKEGRPARGEMAAELKAAIAEQCDSQAASVNTGWQPIETAPVDGAAVLLYYGKDYYVMEGRCFTVKQAFQGRGPSYKWVSAVDMGDLKPAYWMPLPLPPEAEP